MIERIIAIFTDAEVVPRLRTFIMALILFKVLTVAMVRNELSTFTYGLDVVGTIGFFLSIILLTTLMVCKRWR